MIWKKTQLFDDKIQTITMQLALSVYIKPTTNPHNQLFLPCKQRKQITEHSPCKGIVIYRRKVQEFVFYTQCNEYTIYVLIVAVI